MQFHDRSMTVARCEKLCKRLFGCRFLQAIRNRSGQFTAINIANRNSKTGI
jgi:hypothetical protein